MNLPPGFKAHFAPKPRNDGEMGVRVILEKNGVTAMVGHAASQGFAESMVRTYIRQDPDVKEAIDRR